MKSILYARISDNVLDPEDWPVRRLIIEDERIIDHTEMPMTGYPLRSFAGGPQAGWTLEQLLAWSGTDFTGQHPEESHDLKAEGDERYHFVHLQEHLIELLTRGKVRRHVRIDIAAENEKRARGQVGYFQGRRRDALYEGNMQAFKAAEREIEASKAIHQEALQALEDEKKRYGKS